MNVLHTKSLCTAGLDIDDRIQTHGMSLLTWTVCHRDINETLGYKTETFDFQSETRPRCYENRYGDRLETKTTSVVGRQPRSTVIH